METGLSVDDRTNQLNIAFWVISSVGTASPLLLHIIYVSVHAPSLSLSPSFPTPSSLFTHKHIFSSLILSHHPFFQTTTLPHCISVPLEPPSCSSSSFFSLSLSLPLYFAAASITHCLSFLFYSLYLCLPFYPSLPPFSSSLLFFCMTQSELFSSKAIFPFEPLFLFPPSHFFSRSVPVK